MISFQITVRSTLGVKQGHRCSMEKKPTFEPLEKIHLLAWSDGN